MSETREAILISLNNASRALIDALAEEQPSIECPHCNIFIITTPDGWAKLPPQGCENCYGLGFIYVHCQT